MFACNLNDPLLDPVVIHTLLCNGSPIPPLYTLAKLLQGASEVMHLHFGLPLCNDLGRINSVAAELKYVH